MESEHGAAIDAFKRTIKKRLEMVERTFLSAHVHETETSESCVGEEMIDSRYLQGRPAGRHCGWLQPYRPRDPREQHVSGAPIVARGGRFCTETGRIPGRGQCFALQLLTLIRRFLGTLSRIYTEEQRRFDVGFPGYIGSLDVNGKNILLDDLYAPFRKFSSRRRVAVFSN